MALHSFNYGFKNYVIEEKNLLNVLLSHKGELHSSFCVYPKIIRKFEIFYEYTDIFIFFMYIT